MALPTLSDEQVRTLSRSQKDHWWLEHVFRGDMPQLTIRSALTGFLLGGVLAATSLYIGAKPANPFSQVPVEVVNIIPGQFQNVVTALPQRWQVDLDYRQPIVEIDPEPATITL